MNFGPYLAGLGKVLVGAFLLRSLACTINDIFDCEMDAGVERTRDRLLASWHISMLAATLYLHQYALSIIFFYLTESSLA
ncbi:hypothetical protein B0H14DRAFT_2376033 [Mycena olivaceomarginata]|nr:hypothetical protein B0H14DRAFT_2376033 [Mycena olivaceomarginata]